MIHLSSDWSAIDSELDRIEAMPDFKTKVALEQVLTHGVVTIMADTHVLTGSLKSSIKKRSESEKITAEWKGEIEAGGASGGVNNPVDYAIYEKARGEDHNFMASTKLLDPMWIDALKKGLSK